MRPEGVGVFVLGGVLAALGPACFLDSVGEAGPDATGAAGGDAAAAGATGGTTPVASGGAGGANENGGAPASGGAPGAGGGGGSPPLDECGDGEVQSPEICDDGNTMTGDGCSAVCEDEDSCPGALFSLGLGASAHIDGDTTSQQNQGQSSGCNGYGAGSNDLVYAAFAEAAGTLTISWSAAYNAHVYVRATCEVEASEIDCSGTDTDTIAIPIAAGEIVYAIIDGGNSENGAFTLDLALDP